MDRSCTHGGAQCTYNPKHHTLQCTSLNHAEYDLGGTAPARPHARQPQDLSDQSIGFDVEIGWSATRDPRCTALGLLPPGRRSRKRRDSSAFRSARRARPSGWRKRKRQSGSSPPSSRRPAIAQTRRKRAPRGHGERPGSRSHRQQPVVYVTPADADGVLRISGARLPTDDEWEYAARSRGGHPSLLGRLDRRPISLVPGQLGRRPHAVAEKRPNAWGLYDVEGNVWEWTLCRRRSKETPIANSRGGSWIDCEDIDGGPGKKPGHLIGLSTYFKIPIKLSHRYDDIGFRCARSGP